MADSAPLIAISLGVISVCLVVMTVLCSLTAHEVRKTLRRVNVMLPMVEAAVRDLRRLMREGRRVASSAGQIAGHVEAVIERARDAALGMIEPVQGLKRKLRAFVEQQFGNGARSEPRWHHRK